VPKVKIPRRNISLDMTAMCDVAFLLLTFFMLTTKFKPEEKALVDIPSSQSEIKAPDTNIITIAVQKNGVVFFSVDDKQTRINALKKMAEKYHFKVTTTEQAAFAKMEEVGFPFAQLKTVLNLSKQQRENLKYTGVPVDSTNNELADWIRFSRQGEKKFRFAIKGDKDVNYSLINTIIGTLQDENINKFNLITTLEN